MQKYYLNRSLFFILLFISTSLLAVEFGEMKVNSYLYQPLKADMSISNVEGNEKVELADKDSYVETDVDYFAVYDKIKLKQRKNKLIFSSVEPVNHPFLQLLLVVRKEGGEQFRLFTLLLDPIDYTSDSPQIVSKSAVSEDAATLDQPKSKGAQGSQYQIQANDTLSQIVLKNMPSETIPLSERMNSILQQNPDAFIDNDINKIKVGYTLDIPATDQDLKQQTEKNTEQQASKKPVKFKPAVVEADEPIEDDGGRIQLSAEELNESDEEQVDEADTSDAVTSLALVEDNKIEELTAKDSVEDVSADEDKSLKAESVEEAKQVAEAPASGIEDALAAEDALTNEEDKLAEQQQVNELAEEQSANEEDASVIKAENEELQEKLTTLRDKIAELEEKLLNTTQQGTASSDAEPEDAQKVVNVIQDANNLVNENMESQKDEYDLMWIVAAIAVVILLIIYVIYKWIDKVRKRREAYDQIQDIELFSADLNSGHLQAENESQMEQGSMDIENGFSNQSEGVSSGRVKTTKQVQADRESEDEPTFFADAPVGKPQPIVEESMPPLEPVPHFEEVAPLDQTQSSAEQQAFFEQAELASNKQQTEAVKVAEVDAPKQEDADILGSEVVESNEDSVKRETLSYSFEDLGIDSSKEKPAEAPSESDSQESAQTASTPSVEEFKSSGLQLEEIEPAPSSEETQPSDNSIVEDAQAQQASSDVDAEQVENLLNAAKRDVMIGNRAQALRTLEEVLQKGSPEQKSHAQELMKHLGQ